MIRPGGSLGIRFYKLRMLYINSAIAGLSLNTFWVMMHSGKDEILIGRQRKGIHPMACSSGQPDQGLTIRNPIFDRSKMAKIQGQGEGPHFLTICDLSIIL